MKIRNAIYTKSIMNIDMCHVNEIIPVDNCHTLIAKPSSYLIIQNLNNRDKLRNNLCQIMSRPFLKCLSQNCMVCICAGLTYNINRRIHVHPFRYKQANQLRYDHGWMCVVDLDYCVVEQIIKVTSLRLTLIDNESCGIAYHEILLVDTKLSSIFVTVIRI